MSISAPDPGLGAARASSKASIDFITGNGTPVDPSSDGDHNIIDSPHTPTPTSDPSKGTLPPITDSADHRTRTETTAAPAIPAGAWGNSPALDEKEGVKAGAGIIESTVTLGAVSEEGASKEGKAIQIISPTAARADPTLTRESSAGPAGRAGGTRQLRSPILGTSTSSPSSSGKSHISVGEAAPRTQMFFIPGRPFVPPVVHDRRDISHPSTRASPSSSRSNGSPSVYSTRSELPSRPSIRVTPSLDSLPHNVLSRIAYHIVTTSPSSHPGSLSAALASCKTFHQAASFEANPRLYHDLFSHTFDLAALRRRYEWMKKRLVQARMVAIANESAWKERQQREEKEGAEKAEHGSGQVGNGGLQDQTSSEKEGKLPKGPPKPVQLGHPPQNGSASPNAAKNGPSSSDKPIISPAAMSAKQAFDLFDDPRSWAMDYKERWITAKRMRLNVRMHSMEVQGKCSREDMMADLWNIWFMLTENDGKNLHFLAEQCHFVSWMSVYNDDMIQTDAATPGYPEESGVKALGVWIALISGTDLVSEQSANQVDEKIFTLRPYVFACAKYEVLYARWTMRQLPLSVMAGTSAKGPGQTQGQGGAGSGAATGAGIAESTGPSKAVPYKRFGYTWRRAPPNHILGSYLYFLRLLDRQPNRRLSASTPIIPTSAGPSPSVPLPGLFNSSRILPSEYHDREWQRNSVCQDPSSSPGLPVLTFKGELEGYWRGKFLFYDLDMYRRVLAGDVRAVYTGKFGEQHLELELRETVVRVPLEKVGGVGPAVCAGFRDEGEGEMPDEIKRIREGYGYEIVSEEELLQEKQEGPLDEPGWTKEILLSGYGRTGWGLASIRGRVRAWDGMIVLQMAYSRQPMERWVWRGYLHTGGYLLGMWRDSFSPEHQRGYEGPFGIVRAGDVSYPPHLPTAMATTGPAATQISNGQLPVAAPAPGTNATGNTTGNVIAQTALHGQNANVPHVGSGPSALPSTVPQSASTQAQASAHSQTQAQTPYQAIAGRSDDAEQTIELETVAGSTSVQAGASVPSPSVGPSSTPLSGIEGVTSTALEAGSDGGKPMGKSARAGEGVQEDQQTGEDQEGEAVEGQARKRARRE